MAGAMAIALSLKLPTRASLGCLHASKFTDSKTHAATPDNPLPPCLFYVIVLEYNKNICILIIVFFSFCDTE
jgi:hypothetical protein